MAAPAMPAGARLGELLAGWADVPARFDRPVADVTLDSREVVAGGAFFACRGHARHGIEWAPSAIERGATAVVFEPGRGVEFSPPAGVASVAVPDLARHVSAIAGRFFGAPSSALDVVGVTGTNGKSTTVLMLAEALSRLAAPAGVIGTLGAGWPARLASAGLTTPDAVTVQRRLAEFRAQGAAAVAMEASSHGLAQGRLQAIRFQVAVLTNLSRDHLDYHGSQAAYAEAKSRLFTSPGLGAAVLNLDDPFGATLLERLDSSVQAIGYSLTPIPVQRGRAPRRLFARAMRATSDGLVLQIDGDFGTASVAAPLIGAFNAANLLAVLGSLLALGQPLEAAARAMRGLRAAPGRMEPFGGGAIPLALVDYAHTPDALAKALVAARQHASGRVFVVFGCGGDRDRGKRSLMGAAAARHADVSIITDDNPRAEEPAAITTDIAAGFPAHVPVRIEHDRQRAIIDALAEAGSGDVVLVAGKGHETEQLVGAERRPFDDRAVVREALGGA